MPKIVDRCPSCGGNLQVTRLQCPSCGIAVVGQFESCPFCRLSAEDLDLALTFIQCRGNIREMEREMGTSYWTLRRMIDELADKLGLEAEPLSEADATAQMQAILERLDRGEISATEATEALSRLKRSGSA
jgi:hypothetical protein